MKRWFWALSVAAVSALLPYLFFGCGEEEEVETAKTVTAEPNTLVSIKVDKPPALDAGKLDPLWSDAPALQVMTSDGENFSSGKTEIALKSLYSGPEIFFMAQWADPTESLDRTPMVKQPDGTWKKAAIEDGYYEDKLAFLWNISDSITGFNSAGCAVACHPGEGVPEAGFLGKMYTANPGEAGDIWQWMVARTDSLDLSPTINAYVDDEALDWSRIDFSVREAGAGRYNDPGDETFLTNRTEDKAMPLYQWRNRPADPKALYFLPGDNIAPLVDSEWQAGEKIPIYYLRNASGDRADLLAASSYADGKWTLVFKRRLVTGSTASPPVDVQFSDLGKVYYFGVGAFDNSLKHSYYPEPLMLRFSQDQI